MSKLLTSVPLGTPRLFGINKVLSKHLIVTILILVLFQHSILTKSQILPDEGDDFAEFEDEPQPISVDNSPKIAPSGLKPVVENEFKDKTTISPSLAPQQDSKFDTEIDDILEFNENDTTENGTRPTLRVITDAPMPKHHSWDAFYIEIAFIAVFMFYFVNYYIGSSKNFEIANLWYDSNRSFLKVNFALVGGQPVAVTGQDNDNQSDDSSNKASIPKRKALIKDTESNYKLWCSGRVGMEGTLVELDLIKRHDIFSLGLNLLRPSRDNLIFRVQLNPDSLDNFVLCIAQRAASQKLFKEMVDVSTYCPERKPVSKYGLASDRIFVMSEIREVVPYLMDQKISSLIKKYEDCIDFIHITDQFSQLPSQDQELSVPVRLSQVRRMATFSFFLPRNFIRFESASNEDTSSKQTSRELCQLAFTIIDRLRRFKLSREGKLKSEKNRAKIAEILQKTASAQRQEAVQQQKEEQRRLERERVYADNDVELQRRLEKKEQKREMKRSKVRVKQLRIKNNG